MVTCKPSIGILPVAFVLSLSVSLATHAAPKSAIMFIGDGMGIAQVTTGRIFKANARDGELYLDTLPNIAVIRTYAANQLVTDSAAAGTALSCGIKTNNGRIATDAEGEPVETILEKAQKAGKSVGLVTTTTITHATPACFYGHVPFRAQEAELAAQLVDAGNIEVIMGGGREVFWPQGATDPENGDESKRRDDRDLFAEAREKGYTVVMRQSEFDVVAKQVDDGSFEGKILALFNDGMMTYEAERKNDTWGEPALAEMTALAVKILSRNPNGFFLMVEGGRIDHACHDNRAYAAAAEMVAFDDAIREGVEATKTASDTFIVVTADHETGGLAINGYVPIEVGGMELITRPGLGAVTDILSFASGPGANRAEVGGTPRDNVGYKQPSLYESSSAAHTGVDVLAWATGPGSDVVKGTMTNADLGKLVIDVLDLE